MPEPELPHLDATRRERLAALGIELLALRSELGAPSAGVAEAAPAGTQAVGDHARLRISGTAWPASERLPRAVIAALGLRPEEASTEPCPGRPTLAFGSGSDLPEVVSLPPLAELRAAAAKHALWPALRRLRRRLAVERPT